MPVKTPLSLGQMRQCVLKAHADFIREVAGDAVAQPRGIVRLMRNDGNPARAEYDRNGDKAALAEDDAWLNLPDQAACLKIPLDHAERVDKVLPGEIPAHLACRNAVIGHAVERGNQVFFHAVFRADIMNLPAFPLERFDQGDIRRNMSRGAAACKYDFSFFLCE